MTCFPDEVNWNNKEFTKEMLDYLRAVYCVHPMVLDALDYINSLESRIAELEVMVKGHDPFEDFPSKERGFECSVVVLGKFEYEDEFNPITNWDLCVYWFDEERWHPLNGYVAGDDIVKWYSLPEEREE